MKPRMNTALQCRSLSFAIWPQQCVEGNGMEEVVGSIPTRSTISYKVLNTTVGPVADPVDASQPAESIQQAVDHDVSARVNAQFLRSHAVLRVGTRDVERAIKTAVLITAVENVVSFGRLVIPWSRFGTDRIAAQRDFVFAGELCRGPTKPECVSSRGQALFRRARRLRAGRRHGRVQSVARSE